jgi:hypothetical protein
MPHIETNFTRFLQRMEAVQAFVSLRSYDASITVECLSPSFRKVAELDFDLSQAALSGPGWYDSSWDLIQGLVVRETTAAGAGRLDDWSQCLFA